jgi:hypothetical protein
MPRSGSLLRFRWEDLTIDVLDAGAAATFVWPSPAMHPPVVYPLGSGIRVETAPSAPLFDDVTYTILVMGPAKPILTVNGEPLDLRWVEYGAYGVGTTSVTFHQVGWTELAVALSPELPLVGVRLPVASRKLDYANDYLAMVQDLERQVRGLTAQLMSRVLNPAGLADDRQDLDSYWLAVITAVWERLARDLTVAWHTLPPRLEAAELSIDLARHRRPRPHDAHLWMATGRTRVTSRVLRWETITPERRYLLHLLHDLSRRLDRLIHHDQGLRHNLRVQHLHHEVKRLAARLGAGLPASIEGEAVRIPVSPLAQSHPALRQVIRWHGYLRRGLFPESQPWLVGAKDISILYEYWCFVTIIRALVEESGGYLRVEPKVSRQPFDIVLATGEQAAAEVETPSGHRIRVSYGRSYYNLPTTAQRPDYVIRLEGHHRVLLFDAKYRFELHEENHRHYGDGLPIPPIDTINRMHQYRDAIVVREHLAYQRIVDTAVVLFPLPPSVHEAYRRHRFRQSIDAVGVGALGLLPGGSDKELRTLIRRYLAAEAEHADP